MAKQFLKPVRLELGNSGAWQVLGRFDAADDEQASLVLDAAEDLVKTLNNGGAPRYCPTLRVVLDVPGSAAGHVLLAWHLGLGWRDALTGEPA